MSRLVEVIQPTSIRADRLGATQAFAGLARPDLELAAGILTETLVERGARMTVQGRPSTKLWLILEGEALVSADARPIRVATHGDLVGLTSMFYVTNSAETTIALSSIRQRLAAAAKRRGFTTG
jgi:CRP-like cAMP-binding protein